MIGYRTLDFHLAGFSLVFGVIFGVPMTTLASSSSDNLPTASDAGVSNARLIAIKACSFEAIVPPSTSPCSSCHFLSDSSLHCSPLGFLPTEV